MTTTTWTWGVVVRSKMLHVVPEGAMVALCGQETTFRQRDTPRLAKKCQRCQRKAVMAMQGLSEQGMTA